MRRLENRVVKFLMFFSTALIGSGFFMILVPIVYKGLPAINWALLSQTPDGGFYLGKEGGVLNAIVGSLAIAVASSLIGLALALPIALYINAFLSKQSPVANCLRLVMDVLQGIPSIVYGACAFSMMVYLGWQASLGAGVFAMTLLVIPLLVRSVDEVMQLAPLELNHAAFSLGATPFEYAKLILKHCSGGVFTALLLGFGRIIGDAAAVMFTAGFGDNIPTSLADPAPTLPLAIFFQLGSPVHEVQQRGYASAVLLTAILLGINLLIKFIRKKTSHLK